ncbi:MAG: diguanylate cyclase [Paraglaciecola sp.]|uniref:sensor domain-containing diguanylate cyclase n=1 Tax=Paraglaciecola sp. TaxID=1920173 RepID=UPI0032985C2F
MSTSILGTKLSINGSIILAGFCCLLMFITANALMSNNGKKEVRIDNLHYLVDSAHDIDIGQALNFETKDWQTNDTDIYSPAMSDDIHWLKFTIQGREALGPKLIEIDNPFLNRVNVWFVQKNKILSHLSTGDEQPFSERPILHENFVFSVPATTDTIDVYVSAYSTGSIRLPIYLWPEKLYLSYETKSAITMGVFIGLMLAMGICSLFCFVATKALPFLIYSGYVGSLVLTITTLFGLTFRYLWPESTLFQQDSLALFASCLLCLSTIFCDQLLKVKVYSAQLSRLLRVIATIFIIGAGVSFFIPLPLFINAFLSMTLVSGLVVFLTGIWLWKKGSTVAHYYTLTWAMLYLLGLAVVLDNLNIVSFSLSPTHFLMLGATIETIFLALILIISHNKQKQAELIEQTELLDIERQTRNTEKEVLEQQKTATEELEYKVQERTLELEITLRELSEKNQELEKKNTLDSLTGIRNRSYFDKKYQAELRRSKREQTQLSIVMLDIDHFKSVNDIHGHLMGDECIKVVANILKQSLKRLSDDVCRYGGEEFAMILPSTDLEGALALVEKIRIEISNTEIVLNEASVKVTISAGIGTATAEVTMNEKSILALADQQLYKAKNAGRNQTIGSYLS